MFQGTSLYFLQLGQYSLAITLVDDAYKTSSQIDASDNRKEGKEIKDSGNLPDDFLLKDKDQNKASVLVLVLTLRELNISDPAALVVDHNSYVVLNSEGAHTSMATADFDLSAAILRSKKIEAPVLYRGIVHSFNPVNNLESKVLLASPSTYSANPKTKSLNAPMLIGSAIPLVTVVHA
ncbi:hypothetical protein Nepgr_026510 [Nepenthes gracilis]|uniref:Dolichyl-diphosphooligosaccharide--protein glycosyltransferase 48 kDa subunit n=1 Tax=Nepenthes gracilis TaxID=150966 RepID=A0AAD3T8E3_NEPGR|nr:hypothetical protein Nepgr_026510 [Nepenthes gracilis]